MSSRRGQAIGAELVIATCVFIVAIGVISHAYGEATNTGAWKDYEVQNQNAHVFSDFILDCDGAQADWTYASHDGVPLTLCSEGAINLTKAAYLVSMLYDDEPHALDALLAGPYMIGFSIPNQSGKAVNASCPSCDCGGRCGVELQYSPGGSYRNVLVSERVFRLANGNGSAAGLGKIRMVYYRTYD